MQKNPIFLYAGIASFSFYILIVFSFIYYVSSPKPKTYNIKSKATVIQLDMIVKKSDKKRIEKKEDKKTKKPLDKLIKKSTSAASKKRPDLKSLFGKVKTKEKVVKKKEINNVQKSLDPKRFKAKFEKQKKSSNVKIDKLFNDKQTTTNVSSLNSSKNKESDDYYSEVSELLNAWIPTVREDKLISVVEVIITKDGTFNYRIKKYSQNTSFDLSLKAFLEEQKSIIYPKPKKGKTVRINVDFKSEG